MTVVLAPKRSSVAGKVPTTSDLYDGEICVNFADRIIYQRVGSTIRAISEPEELKHVTVNNLIDWMNVTQYYQGTTLAIDLDQGLQQSNHVLAGPILKGSASYPSFRRLTRADMAFPRDYISGLSIRTNNTHINISQGSVVLIDGSFVEVPAQTLSPARAANTLYFLYVTASGVVERTTAAPAVVYWGSARASSAGGVNRFIGMVATDGSGNYLHQWTDFGNNQVTVQYIHNTTALTSLITNGTSTTPADLSMAQWLFGAVVTQVMVRVYHNGTGGTIRLYTWNGSAFVIFTNIPAAGNIFVIPAMVDNTPKIQYDVVGAGAQVSVILMGYMYAR